MHGAGLCLRQSAAPARCAKCFRQSAVILEGPGCRRVQGVACCCMALRAAAVCCMLLQCAACREYEAIHVAERRYVSLRGAAMLASALNVHVAVRHRLARQHAEGSTAPTTPSQQLASTSASSIAQWIGSAAQLWAMRQLRLAPASGVLKSFQVVRSSEGPRSTNVVCARWFHGAVASSTCEARLKR